MHWNIFNYKNMFLSWGPRKFLELDRIWRISFFILCPLDLISFGQIAGEMDFCLVRYIFNELWPTIENFSDTWRHRFNSDCIFLSLKRIKMKDIFGISEMFTQETRSENL